MFTRLLAYVRGIAGRSRAGSESRDELAFHLEHEIAANVARGLSPAEARRIALRDLGGLTQTTEAVRDVRTMWLDAVWQDSVYAWRRFARERGLVAAAVLTFALGIGATTATYSVVYGILLRPLPVADEDSLVVAYSADRITALSHPWFELWRTSGAFADLAGTSRLQLDLTGDPGAERVDASGVSDNFFNVLGVRAAIGRVFTTADRRAPDIPAVISDRLWRRRFGADPTVLGTELTAGTLRAVIVGVMPRGFERWRGTADVWMPIERSTDPGILESFGYYLVTPVGRLARGTSLQATSAVLESIPDPGESSSPAAGVRLVRLRDDVVPFRIERLLVIVFGAMLLTWLVVCANLSLLLLERGARRSRELAVRLALGASRVRVCAQLLTESTWLALVGGALGLCLARWAVSLFIASGPPDLFDENVIHLDGPVVAFALVLTVVTATASGIAPALRSSRTRAILLARESSSVRDKRLSHVLVVSQIAVALMVLVGASLLVKSLVRMQQVDLGFDDAHVLTVGVNLPASRYGEWSDDNVRYVQAQRELIERVAVIPEVDGVTVGSPVFTPGSDNRVSVAFDDGRRLVNGDPDDRPFAPGQHFIGPDYMCLHDIGIVSGREFRASDNASIQQVVLVNETMARLHWADADPVGRRLNFGRARSRNIFDESWATIVGVVADVRHSGIDLPVKPEVYRAQFQHPRPTFQLVLRTAARPEVVMSAVRDMVRAFDPEIPIVAVRPLTDIVADTTVTARYSSTLLASLAGMAVVLSSVGVFCLLASTVAARRREIAIRMALGALPRHMVQSVLARVATLVAIGLSIGAIATLLAAQGLSGMLFEITPLDPMSHLVGVLVLILATVLTAWIPARRAARVDPLVALRLE